MQNFITRLCSAISIRPLRWSLFLCACLLAGCSALRFGYANGDTVIYWWLDSYVDFTDEQKPWVKRRIDTVLAWHRKTQLSEYAQFLAQLQPRLNDKLTSADAHAAYAEIRKRALPVLDEAMPDLADLALSLQPQQIARLERKFASNNEAYRKDYLRGSLEDRQRYRYKKVMKQAEYWFGDFNPQQEAQIRAASDARPLENELWAAERLRRQQELLRILQKARAEQLLRDAVIALLRDYAQRSFESFTYEENKVFFDGSRDGTAHMVAVIANVATPVQRAHAIKRVQRWIDDFHAMATAS